MSKQIPLKKRWEKETLEFNRTPEKWDSILLHTPKTAGTSVAVALHKNHKETLHYHHHPTAVFVKNHLLPTIWDNCFKFAFVRNPWSHAVSYYLWSKKTNMINRKLNFPDFISNVYGITGSSIQHNFFCDGGGNLILDFVGKFENLYEDFSHICEKLNIKCLLPWKRQLPKYNYREFYNDDLIQVIAQKSKIVIDLFDYKFEI